MPTKKSMLKLLMIVTGLFIGSELLAQDSSRLWKYELGVSLNYSGNEIPDFTFPVGLVIDAVGTINNFAKIKPTVELNVIGFPEFVLGRSMENIMRLVWQHY